MKTPYKRLKKTVALDDSAGIVCISMEDAVALLGLCKAVKQWRKTQSGDIDADDDLSCDADPVIGRV